MYSIPKIIANLDDNRKKIISSYVALTDGVKLDKNGFVKLTDEEALKIEEILEQTSQFLDETFYFFFPDEIPEK